MAALLAWSVSASLASANSAPLPVAFADNGPALPQAQIRIAIAAELGRETLAEADQGSAEQGNRERVLVAVDERGELWVRYFGPRGLVDRHLPMPTHPEQIPVVVSLTVGNLARQEAFELLRDIERRRRAEQAAAAAEPVKKPVAAPAKRALAPQPALPRRKTTAIANLRASPKNSWGHYLVADIAFFPGKDRNCTPGSRDECYDWAYLPIEYDVEGSGRVAGIVPAHGRYVMAYSRALLPDLWASARVGFAFASDDTQDEAAARVQGIDELVPWLFEGRVQGFPYASEFRGAFRPFAHLTAGYADVSPVLEVQPPQEVMSDERGGTPIHIVYPLGPFFAGGGLGGSWRLFGPVRIEAELSGFFTFPATGWFVRPSGGATYDF